jgi:hypothetical protein
MAKPPLTIGILTAETARFSRFWNSLLGLDLPADTRYVTKLGLNIAKNRNEIIAASADSDYVWFIDDDHTFDSNLVMNLLKHQAPIVQPLVLSRHSPFGPVAMGAKAEDREGFYWRIALDNSLQSGLVKCEAVGAAGMLIRRDVIEAVGDPWFETHAEDVNFCQKAKAKGFGVYCDLSNSMGHMNVGNVRPIIKDGKWVTQLTMGEGDYYLPTPKGKK